MESVTCKGKYVFIKSKIKPRTRLGIDMGSSVIKIIQLSYSNQQVCVDAYAISYWHKHLEHDDAMGPLIQTMLVTANMSCKQAVIAVPDSETISKVIQVHAAFNECDLNAWVMLEAEQFVACPLEEVSVDFDVLGPSINQPGMLDVLVVASRVEHVNHRFGVIQRAGLDVCVVDVESYAIERAACASSMMTQGKIVVLVDVRKFSVHLQVFHGARTVFFHEESFRDNRIKNPVAHDEFLLLITRGLQRYSSTHPGFSVQRMLLLGDRTNLQRMRLVFQDEFEIPVCFANPFAEMSYATEINVDKLTYDAPLLMVACGLALRCMS